MTAIKRKKSKAKKVKKINEALYWKFRCYAEAMEHDRTRLELCRSARESFLLKSEISSLKARLANESFKKQDLECQQSSREYDNIKAEVELVAGTSLNDKQIDPTTMKIKGS